VGGDVAERIGVPRQAGELLAGPLAPAGKGRLTRSSVPHATMEPGGVMAVQESGPGAAAGSRVRASRSERLLPSEGRSYIGQTSWESAPGATSGVVPGYATATHEQRVEFHSAIRRALTDEAGRDKILTAFDIPSPGTVDVVGMFA